MYVYIYMYVYMECNGLGSLAFIVPLASRAYIHTYTYVYYTHM